MDWRLPEGRQPAYLRVINLITNAIEAGDLLPGERLPAERVLAERLGLNRSTIQRALAELVSSGLLLRRVGSGTWVNPDRWGVATTTQWHDYLTTNRLLGPDPFTVRLAKARQEEGVINLADSSITNQLALPLTPQGLSVAALYAQEHRVEITGDPMLKAAVVATMRPLLGEQLETSQVLITSGAQQAFYLLAQGLLSDGDAIAVEAPSYFYQLTLFQAAGVRIYGVPLHDGQLDLQALRDVYHQHHVRFLLVNPTGQNPTGATMSLAARQRLLATCQELHLPLVEDDQLGINVALGQVAPPPLYALDPQNVLSIGTLSPLLGAHTRIGWLIAPPSIAHRLAQIRQQMEAELSIFPQQLAVLLLHQQDLPQALRHQQAQLAQRQAALAEALAPAVAAGQLAYQVPQATNHFWVTIHCRRALQAADYQRFLQAKVLVRPDFLFGTRHNQVRLSFAHFLPEQVAPLRERLGAVLAQLCE